MATATTTRRLAAILAADVVGYSRLMGADEEGTHERFKAHLVELLDPKIRERHGRIVKTTGDGVLAEFASVVDAVRCAGEIQRAMADRDLDLAEERRLRFRIGVNLGDVIADGGDIYGDGVNIAARLEGLAAPGGICVSRTVRDHIGDRLPYAFEDIGEQSVKNIARPVRVYALRLEGTAGVLMASGPSTTSRSPPAAAPRLSINVHQFHSGSSAADAITNCMLFVQSMVRSFGFESDIFVEHMDPALAGRVRRLEDLEIAEKDLLLVHHSMGHDAFPRIADLRCRKVLVYHNITPPQFFAEDDPFHSYAIKGYAQLSLFRDIVELAIAVSSFNARQLSRRGFDKVTVIPLLKDFAAIRDAPHSKTPYYDEAAVFRLLFVGRLVPHKCQHELIDFVDHVRSIGRIPLELILVGHFDEADPYKVRLDELARRSGLDRHINIIGRVTDEELFGWYRAASAYVSLSEHEGFGVPLVEAMAFDLPVVAYASSAVPDTLGEAGIPLFDKNPASILEALLRLHEDRWFRAEVIRSQRRRLSRLSRRRIEDELRDWLIGAGAYEDDTEGSGRASRFDDDPGPARRTHYLIEGPFETSYSLAVVNRNLALALGEREGCASHIEPADGTEAYTVDAIAAAKLPLEIRKLVGPAPVTAERIVTIRNTYPPRPNGMIGDMRFVHLAWEESAIPDTLADADKPSLGRGSRTFGI